MLQFADRAWSDEQKEFRCNTKEPGKLISCHLEKLETYSIRFLRTQIIAEG